MLTLQWLFLGSCLAFPLALRIGFVPKANDAAIKRETFF